MGQADSVLQGAHRKRNALRYGKMYSLSYRPVYDAYGFGTTLNKEKYTVTGKYEISKREMDVLQKQRKVCWGKGKWLHMRYTMRMF